MKQVGYTDTAAADLVFVTRADPPRSGADRDPVVPPFRHLLDDAVKRKNHVSPVADGQLTRDVDARRFERMDLVDQSARIDHNPVSDYGFHARPQDSARDQFQDELLGADIDGVSRIVPALIARDNVKFLREQVDHLALALVAPLCAQYD